MNAIHTIIAWIKNKVLSKQNLDFVLLQLKLGHESGLEIQRHTLP